MHPVRKVILSLYLSILASLFVSQISSAATYIFSPEDHSVYIDQRDPDLNKLSKSGILVASAVDENARIVIHFDLDGWNSDSISQAKLHLWHWRGGNYSGSRIINVYPLTSGFDESTATWNFPWTTPGGDYDNSMTTAADVDSAWGNWVEWDVTDILKDRWSNIANYGFLLKDPVEDSPDEPYIKFHCHREDSLPYLEVTTAGTSVGDDDVQAVSRNFSLGQNFPNPFNHQTLMKFTLSRSAQVSLVIYNIRGEKVKTLLDKEKSAGTYTMEWNGTNQSGEAVASGIYLYQLRTESFSETKRLLFLK